MDRWRRWAPAAWSVALAMLMLGPALQPGFVLSYDMVWVPDLALTRDAVGLGSGLPRAVPSDAVVAVLDEVIPGMLLQKVVLLGILVGAGTGIAVVLREKGLFARLAAVTFYQWNAFVVERLVIGHWPVLVSYAVLPWIVLHARRTRERGRMSPALWALVPLASLSASAGLMAGVVLVAFALRRRWSSLAGTTLLLVVANAPWVLSGLLHRDTAYTDPRGAVAFATGDEGQVPGPLAALTGGGIWNTEVVPGSRTGILGWVWLGLLLLIVLAGARRWWSRTPSRERVGLVACGLAGWAIAAAGWARPEALSWLGDTLPGAGLLRDSSRYLGLLMLPLATLSGAAAAELRERLPDTARLAVAALLVVGPVALLTDAAFGASGNLGAVAYPTDYGAARKSVHQAIGRGLTGDAVLLPMSSYRQPSWNNGHKVLDPTGRYLGVDYVASDDLFVSGRPIRGEDRRANRVERAIRLPDPRARADVLRREGVGFVVVELEAGISPDVTGDLVHWGDQLAVKSLRNPPPDRPAPTSWKVSMAVGWALYCGALGYALARGVVNLLDRARRHPS